MTSQNLSLSGNTMGVNSGARSANSSGAPEFIPSFSVVRVARSLMFSAVFCRSLFVLVPLAIVLSFLLCTTFDYPIVLSVLLFTAFDPFGILKHFLRQTIIAGVNVLLCFVHFNISLCFCKHLCDLIDQCNAFYLPIFLHRWIHTKRDVLLLNVICLLEIYILSLSRQWILIKKMRVALHRQFKFWTDGALLNLLILIVSLHSWVPCCDVTPNA